jgi:ATP-dependent 26S proteasome regulatory subunit
MIPTPSSAEVPPSDANSILERPYTHLLRSKRIEDLWMLAMLVRHTDLLFILQTEKGLASTIVRSLRLGAISAISDQAGPLARRLHVTYQQMRKRRRQYRLPRILRGNLELLTQRMGLSETEQRVLALSILLRSNHSLFMVASATTPSINVVQQLAQVIDSSTRSVISAIAPSGLLQRSQLVTITPGESLGGNVKLVRASFRRLALASYDDSSAMLGGVIKAGQRSTMTMAAYGHLRPTPHSIATILKEAVRNRRRGVNILLYGPPGTGKTELARLLAQEIDAEIFEVPSSELGGASLQPKERLSCAATAQVLLMKLRALLVFDEIDSVFTDGSQLFGKPTTAETAKCWVNELLEDNPVPMVWIANRIGGMDPAFIRRFDLVVHVDTPPQASRLELLRKECGFFDETQLRRLSRADRVTPAVVVRAARVAARVGGDSKSTGRLVEDLIDGVLKAQGQPLLRQQCRSSGIDDYDLTLCNTDVDLASLRDGLRCQPSGRVCLYGPPGTGKSAFGAWLAQQLDRPLLLKRISDLQSPWIGEMERNLAKAFEQASRDGSVLQIDEVDSYLQDRRSAQRSWEVSQVNEFLTQLESFDGVFIASTNLMEKLDPAVLRRFDFKIRMGYLSNAQVCSLLATTARGMGIDVLHEIGLIARTRGLDRLTPGDFAVLARQQRSCPVQSIDQLLKALWAEQSAKESVPLRIGFV